MYCLRVSRAVQQRLIADAAHRTRAGSRHVSGQTRYGDVALHFALSLQFLQGMSHHIPYDFALAVPVRQARKAIHDRLARLIMVNCELRDRLP